MKKYLIKERLENLIEFVINDQIIMSKDMPEYKANCEKIKNNEEAKGRIYSWVRDHQEWIETDTENVCNPKFYTMIVDAIILESYDMSGDIDNDTAAFDYEKQYANGDWDR